MNSYLPQGTAGEIVRLSRSNLAFALGCLPRRRREDMYVFYAFCRTVDDIADDPGWTPDQRHEALGRWRRIVTGAVRPDPGTFEAALIDVRDRYTIPAGDLLGIIDGVTMDIERREYASWEDLRQYCYRVAGCVGLASIRIFGCTHPKSRDYAIYLGYALQLTNILRDIRADWENGERIYLPADEMAAAGYTRDDIANHRYNDAFRRLMKVQVARARDYYHLARESLTTRDRRPLLAAEGMRRIYSETLYLMENDGCRVYDKRYRLSKIRKVRHVAGAWFRGWFGGIR